MRKNGSKSFMSNGHEEMDRADKGENVLAKILLGFADVFKEGTK